MIQLKPKFHYAEFHRKFPAGKVADTYHKVANSNGDKSWNHEVSVKVTDINHESRGHKPSRHVKMFVTKSAQQVRDKPVCVILMEFSLLLYTGKVRDKVCGLCREHKSWKSATWLVSRTFMICVCNFPPGNVRWKSRSRRNGIWA